MAGGQTYSITFTSGLIDKLAGRPLRSAREAGAAAPQAGATMPRAVLHPELLAMKQHDAQLAHALTASRRLGSALLKAEEVEAGKVKALTTGMLSKHRTVMQPVGCQAQRNALLQCYSSSSQDVLRCSSLVDAYVACADAASMSLRRRPSSAEVSAPAA